MMQTHERQLVIDKLKSSETLILSLVKDLTPAQWNFREGPNRWSIAENIEHLVVFEHFMNEAITKCLQCPRRTGEKGPAPPKKSPTSSPSPAPATQQNSSPAKPSVPPADGPTQP